MALLDSASTTERTLGRPSPQTPVAPAPRISPGERDYLRNQAKKIFLGGGSEQDVVNFVKLHVGRPTRSRAQAVGQGTDVQESDTPTQDNLVSGLSLNALQGLTFGFGDEAVGSLLGVLSGEGAAGGIESYRRRLQTWNNDNPKKAFGAELFGGFLTGAGGARALGLGVKATMGGKLLTAGAEGVAVGAVAGAGYAQGDISERTKAALGGAAFGGILGPAFVGLASAAGIVLKPTVRRVLNKFKGLQDKIPALGSSQAHAEHFLLETLDAEGLGIEDLRAAANAMRANGTSPTLADVGGEGTLQLLSETLSSRTPVKQKLAEELLSRQAEQGARLSGGLFRKIFRSDNFGLRNAYDAVDDLATARVKASAPLYEESYQHLVPTTPRLKQILANPKFRAAWEEGRKIAQTEELAGLGRGLDIPDLPATSLRDAAEQQLIDLGVEDVRLAQMMSQLPDDFPDALPVRGIDYMKRGLDVVIKKALKKEGALDAQEMRALRQLREEVLEFVDEAVPVFGQARAVWGGTSAAMEAVELGQQFLTKPPPIVAREMAAVMKKSPGLADFYRLGAAQTLYEKATGSAARGESADLARSLFGGRLFGARNQDADRIRALFPDAPEVAEDFMRQVAAETRISHTARAARGGKLGRGIQEFEEAVEGTPPNVRMTPQLTILGALRDGVVKVQKKFRQDISDDLASMFSRGIDDPAELDLLLDRLSHVETRRLMQQRFGRDFRAGLAATLGIVSGKLTGGAR